MRALFMVLVVGPVLFRTDAGAQQFEPVPLDLTEVEILVPDGPTGGKYVAGTLPLEVPWSGRGGSGLASAALVSGEVELVFTADLSTPGNPIVGLRMPSVQFTVPNVGSPETPLLFMLHEVSSDRAITTRPEFRIDSEGNLYSSTTVAGLVLSPLYDILIFSPAPPSFVKSFLPNDLVEFSSSLAVGGDPDYEFIDSEVHYTIVSPESFTEVFRFSARAVRPLEGSAVTALPPWGLALLAGVLLGVSARVRRGRRVEIDA